MKKVISLVLALALFAMSAVAFAATPVAATDLAYKGELVLMHFSTSRSPRATAAPTASAPPSRPGKRPIPTSP